MSEQTTATTQTTESDPHAIQLDLPSAEPAADSAASTIPAHVRRACDIAAGRAKADPAERGRRVRAAHKDLNCKGRGPWWYKMVYRGGAWTYFSDERLPLGTFLAGDRRATVYGEVYAGELLICHDKGAGVDPEGWLVALAPDGSGEPLVAVPVVRQRDGQLRLTLPDGSVVTAANPRRS